MKTFFVLKDNILDKKLTNLINSHTFCNRKCVTDKIAELTQFYAANFCKNDIKKAEKQLENQNYEMRRKDALLISFFCGTITVIIFMFIALLSIPDSTLDKHINGTIKDSTKELFS